MMKRALLFLLSLFLFVSLACQTPLTATATPTPTPTPLPLPPAIAETVPPQGSELGLKPVVLFYFNQPMLRPSVEMALTNSLNLAGIYTWADDSTLVFTATQYAQPQTRLVFTLGAGVTSSNNQVSGEAQTFAFQIASELGLAQTLPADGARDVSPTSAIVATFNQPMVPLGADPASLPPAFQVQPAAQGRGEWLNTSTYIFYPQPALSGGATYTATINAALTSANGSALALAPSWSFVTSNPRVVEFTPSLETALALDPVFVISFNQPMDTASVNALASLQGPSGAVTGSYEWNENATVLTFTPQGLLARNTAYRLVIPAEARSKGGAPLENPVNASFTTYPDFSVLSGPDPASPKQYRDAFPFGLSAPIKRYDFGELVDYVTISPSVNNLYVYANQTSLTINGAFQAEQTYSITISGEVQDQWGQKLGRDYTFRASSYPSDPQLIQPYWGTLFVRPQKPTMTVQVVRVGNISVTRAPLDLQTYFRLQEYTARNNFQPQNATTEISAPPFRESVISYEVPLGNNLPTGMYYLDINTDPGVGNYQAGPSFMFVSNINASLKVDGRKALVWAVDLRANQPVANAPVSVYDQNGILVSNGVTDSSGLWISPEIEQFKGYGQFYAAINQPGNDLFGFASTEFNAGLAPWNFGIPAAYREEDTNIYLYADRPIYRPGQTISYRGIVTNAYNTRYTPLNPSPQNWEAQLLDPESRPIQRLPISLDNFGSFSGQVALPDTAQPGWWALRINQKNPDEKERAIHILSFQVADYRKPEMQLFVNFDKAEVLSGETIQATARAEYYFGAPVNDLPFEWSLYRQDGYFGLPDGFYAGDRINDWWDANAGQYGESVASGKGRTDAQGNFLIPLDGLETDSNGVYTLEVTASEAGGFPLSARGEFIMHPAPYYTGIRPAQWMGRAGTPLNFDLTLAGWDKKAIGGKTLKAQFESVRWEQSKDSSDYYPRFQPVYTPLEEKSVTLGSDGLGKLAFTPSAPGTYAVTITHEKARSRVMVWVGGQGDAVWPRLPFDQIKLTVGKETYKPDETAEVFIPNPFSQPALALITSERGAILSAQQITIQPGGQSISISLSDDNAPNTYISATLLGPDAQFRVGYIGFKVDPVNLVLNVEVKATPEKARPGDQLTLDLRVTDSKGQPVQGQFSLAVVDLAVLALADPTAPDIVPAYYSAQPLGVRGGLSLAVYSQRLHEMLGGRGGGGGDGIPSLREKFPDTALWTVFVTAADGRAQTSLTLPDSLTTWQVDTRGVDQSMRVGQARLNVVTSKELLLRPVTPRFLVAGDRVLFGTQVNNTTNQDLQTSVGVQVKGLRLEEADKVIQQVNVPANGRVMVQWWATVEAAENAEIIFTAKAGNYADATRPADGAIPILRYLAPQTFSTAGVLPVAATRAEIISLPRSFQPQGGELSLEFTPSLGQYLLEAAKSLENPDENASNAELASRILAEVGLLPALRQGRMTETELQTRESLLSGWLSRLRRGRNYSDSGWGWFPNDLQFGNEKSNPFITAQVLAAFGQAYRAGLVPETSLSDLASSQEFLAKQLQVADTMSSADLDRAVLLAYGYYSLPGRPMLETDPLTSLYTLRERLSPSSRALLFEMLKYEGQVQPNLLENLQTSAVRSASGAFWDNPNRQWEVPGSPRYTTGVALTSLVAETGVTPLVEDALRTLIASQPSGIWRNNLENAWALRAIAAILEKGGDLNASYAFNATLNKNSLLVGNAAEQKPQRIVIPLEKLQPAAPNELLINRLDGPGKLYYRADLNILRLAKDAPPLNQGLTVLREYLDCAATPCKPITSWKMGETAGRVTVRVTVVVPHDMYYLNVEDFVPAGAEIVNPNLKTSQQGEQSQEVQAVYDPENPYKNGWGWWFFQSPKIYRDHIRWSAEQVSAGTYVLSYTIVPSIPGQYQAIPAHAWLTYFPEVQGTSAGAMFEIVP